MSVQEQNEEDKHEQMLFYQSKRGKRLINKGIYIMVINYQELSIYQHPPNAIPIHSQSHSYPPNIVP